MVRQVQPLRISKSTPTASPEKQAAMSRPLAEISSGSTRRNSPSYNQSTMVSRWSILTSQHVLTMTPESTARSRALTFERERFSLANITIQTLTT